MDDLGFDVNDFLSDELEDKYGGVGGSTVAAGLGLARGATFGLSDVALTKAGVSPQTLKGYQEENPISSTVGEIGSAFLPTGAASVVAKAGLGVAKALPAASKVVQGAAQYATEGALFGLGQSISESALGDHDLVSEQTLGNIGFSAIMSGGIGAVVGKLSKTFPGSPEATLAVEKAKQTATPGSDVSVISNLNIPADEKVYFLDKMTKLKPEAETLKKEFSEVGLPVVTGQLSDSKDIQNISSVLSQLPLNEDGRIIRESVQQGYSKVDDIIRQSFGASDHLDAAAGGAKAKELIADTFEQKYAPFRSAYAEREAVGNAIKIADDVSLKAYDDLVDLSQKYKNETNPGRKVIREEAENFLKEASAEAPITKLDAYSKSLGQSGSEAFRAGKYDIYEAYKSVQRKVDHFRDLHLEKYGEAGEVEAYKALKKEYAKFKSIMSDFTQDTKLGKKAMTEMGLDEILAKIPDEKFIDKIFDPKNAKGLARLQKEFPEVFDVVVQQKKSQMYVDAMNNKKFNPYNLLKNIDDQKKISTGVKDLLFTPEQRRQMEIAKKWMENLPEKIGPSGTPEGMAWMELAQDPTKGLITHFTNKYGARYAKRMIDQLESGQGSQTLRTLMNIEKGAQRATKKINTGITNLLESGGPRKALLMGVSKVSPFNNEEYEKIINDVQETANNPSVFQEKVSSATEGLYNYAPNINNSMQVGIVRGMQFLQSKIPPGATETNIFQEKKPASKYDIAKFKRYYDVVDNPMVAMDQLAVGFIPSETIETLTAVYPRLYMDMKQQVIDRITSMKDRENITYNTKMVLSKFMGEPMVKSLNPQTIQSIQGVFQQAMQDNAQKGQPQKVNQSGMNKMDLAERTGLGNNEESNV